MLLHNLLLLLIVLTQMAENKIRVNLSKLKIEKFDDNPETWQKML